MTLVEHLVELRQRIVKTILAVFAGAVVGFALYPRFLNHLAGYYREAVKDPNAKLIILGPVEGITTRLTVATYGGMVLALPVIMWQFWKFIAPGLYAKERKYGIAFVVSSGESASNRYTRTFVSKTTRSSFVIAILQQRFKNLRCQAL